MDVLLASFFISSITSYSLLWPLSELLLLLFFHLQLAIYLLHTKTILPINFLLQCATMNVLSDLFLQ